MCSSPQPPSPIIISTSPFDSSQCLDCRGIFIQIQFVLSHCLPQPQAVASQHLSIHVFIQATASCWKANLEYIPTCPVPNCNSSLMGARPPSGQTAQFQLHILSATLGFLGCPIPSVHGLIRDCNIFLSPSTI